MTPVDLLECVRLNTLPSYFSSVLGPPPHPLLEATPIPVQWTGVTVDHSCSALLLKTHVVGKRPDVFLTSPFNGDAVK